MLEQGPKNAQSNHDFRIYLADRFGLIRRFACRNDMTNDLITIGFVLAMLAAIAISKG